MVWDERKKRPFKDDVEQLVNLGTQDPNARSRLGTRLRNTLIKVRSGRDPNAIEDRVHKVMQLFNDQEQTRDGILDRACNIYKTGMKYAGKYYTAFVTATALTAALLIGGTVTAGIYAFKIRPETKALETRIEKAKSLESKLTTKNKDAIYSGRSYEFFVETDGNKITGYRIEVNPILPNEPKIIFDIDNDAIYGKTGLIELMKKAEANDRNKGKEGPLGDRIDYTPEQCVQLLQTIYDHEKGNITTSNCQKAHSRILNSGGLKEIVGGSE